MSWTTDTTLIEVTVLKCSFRFLTNWQRCTSMKRVSTEAVHDTIHVFIYTLKTYFVVHFYKPLFVRVYRWKKVGRQKVYRYCWAKRKGSSMERIPIVFCPVMTWHRLRSTTSTTKADGRGFPHCYFAGKEQPITININVCLGRLVEYSGF